MRRSGRIGAVALAALILSGCGGGTEEAPSDAGAPTQADGGADDAADAPASGGEATPPPPKSPSPPAAAAGGDEAEASPRPPAQAGFSPRPMRLRVPSPRGETREYRVSGVIWGDREWPADAAQASQGPLETLQRWFAACRAGDLDALEKLYTDEAWRSRAADQGPDAWRSFLEGIASDRPLLGLETRAGIVVLSELEHAAWSEPRVVATLLVDRGPGEDPRYRIAADRSDAEMVRELARFLAQGHDVADLRAGGDS